MATAFNITSLQLSAFTKMLYMSSSTTYSFRIVNLGYGPLKLDRSPVVLPQNSPHMLELVNVRIVEERAMATMLMSSPRLQHLSIRNCHVTHAGWKSLRTAISNHVSRSYARNSGPRLQSLHLEDLCQRSSIDSTQASQDWDVRYQTSRTLCSEEKIQTFVPHTHAILAVQCSPIPDNDPRMLGFKAPLRKPDSYPGSRNYE